MKKSSLTTLFKYIIAYLFLLLTWGIIFFLLFQVFGILDKKGGTISLMILGSFSSYVYHKYKPMAFEEILEKYLNIKLSYFLSWKYIKYKFMLLIGTDKKYLDNDESFK